MAKVVNIGGSPVNDGERRVIQYLRENLPDSYSLFPNVEIAVPRQQSYEFDIVVVCPHALYAVEIKDWRGTIVGDDHIWLLNDGKERPSPVSGIAQKARVLKSHLVNKGAMYQQLWVENLVILADDRVELELDGPSAYKAVRLSEAPAVFQDVRRQPFMRVQPVYNYAADALKGVVRRRAGQVRKFGSYIAVEELRREPGLAEFRARHVLARDQAARYRVRVREISAYLPPAELERRLNRARRDYDAVREVGVHLNLLPVLEFFQDGEQYVEVSDWAQGGTLAARLAQKGAPLMVNEKLAVLLGLARGLAAVHARGVVHRDICSTNVLLSEPERPQLMNFDKAYISARSGEETIWEPDLLSEEASRLRPHLPPELFGAEYAATPTSDVFSMGVLFFEVLFGRRPYPQGPIQALRDGAVAPPSREEAEVLPEGLADLVVRMCAPRAYDRPADAAAVLAELEPIVQPRAIQPPAPARAEVDWRPGDLIDGDIMVEAVLGSGGFSRVYKVWHEFMQAHFAMKVMLHDDSAADLINEVQKLEGLHHPRIARARFASRLRSGHPYLLLEYIQGTPLDKFTAGEERLPFEQVARCGAELLEALGYIHAKGILHRDIKPSNLMLTDDGLKVIDFNVAKEMADISHTMTGTQPYLPPDWPQKGWSASTDLFAAGCVVYELALGRHPYATRHPMIDRMSTDPLALVPGLSDEFAAFLRRGTAPDEAERFRSAEEMLAALHAVPRYLRPAPAPVGGGRKVYDLVPVEEVGRPNYNPFVTQFLTMYSQARTSNKGTRGYDKVAEATYVSTRLDDWLRKDVLEGRYALILTTGNAGDGKTSSIQGLEEELRRRGVEVVPTESGNGSAFRYGTLSFLTNYDGSQDEGDRDSDTVLYDFLLPFRGDAPEAPGTQVRLLAINEGRLRDFLLSRGAEFRALREALEGFFDTGVQPLPWLLVVNLNWRSLVAGGRDSIFERQLDALQADEFWTDCQTCQFAGECYAKFNVDTLKDPESGPVVREHLRHLLGAVHVRRSLHTTMRDLRSALSYLLFRDRTCTEIGQFLAEATPLERLEQHYYNAWFADARPGDRLVAELAQLDPAVTADPADDRALHVRPREFPWRSFVHRSRTDLDLAEQVAAGLSGVGADPAELRAHWRRLHAVLRRKAYFERLGVRWQAMLPYRSLARFQEALLHADVREAVKAEIIRAISRFQGYHYREVPGQDLYLRVSALANPAIWSYRVFPAGEFVLKTTESHTWSTYVETAPDQLFLEHSHSGFRLPVTLDVFELFTRVLAGYTPTIGDRRGPLVSVSIFLNALASQPFRRAVLADEDGSLYEIAAADGSLALSKVVVE